MFKKIKLFTRYLRAKVRDLKFSYFSVICSRKSMKDRSSLTDIKKVALLRWDGKLGDTIMTCHFIRLLEENDPSIEITVFSSSEIANEWIRKVSSKVKIINSQHRKFETPAFFKKYSKNFDVAFDSSESLRLKDMLALHYLNAKINIGYAMGNVFDINIPREFVNIKDRQEKAVSLLLGREVKHSKLPIPIFSNCFDFEKTSDFTVAFNFFGANKYRSFSFESAIKLIEDWLLEWPDEYVILIPVPGQMEYLSKLEKTLSNKRVFLPKENPGLDLTLSILSVCDLCFTPDTSVVHMASVLNTPTLAVYRDAMFKYRAWKPLADNSRTVFYKDMVNEVDRGYVDSFNWSELVSMKNEITDSLHNKKI